jgi:mono/diheme cytochrome c family protein
MKRCVWAAALGAAAAFAVTAVLGVVLLHGGISARVEPSALEARLARALRGLAIPSDARDATNPVPASAGALATGLAHFADHCASCHANDGSGRTALGRSLYPRAPDMRSPATQDLTDGELFYIIENGVRLTGMPAWGGPGSAEGSWQLVRFIRHLPQLTEEERTRMEALNPRSPDEWRALEDEEAFLRGEYPAPREPGHGGHAH